MPTRCSAADESFSGRPQADGDRRGGDILLRTGRLEGDTRLKTQQRREQRNASDQAHAAHHTSTAQLRSPKPSHDHATTRTSLSLWEWIKPRGARVRAACLSPAVVGCRAMAWRHALLGCVLLLAACSGPEATPTPVPVPAPPTP